MTSPHLGPQAYYDPQMHVLPGCHEEKHFEALDTLLQITKCLVQMVTNVGTVLRGRIRSLHWSLGSGRNGAPICRGKCWKMAIPNLWAIPSTSTMTIPGGVKTPSSYRKVKPGNHAFHGRCLTPERHNDLEFRGAPSFKALGRWKLFLGGTDQISMAKKWKLLSFFHHIVYCWGSLLGKRAGRTPELCVVLSS